MADRRCAICGEACEELEPAFRRPDAVFAVPAEERPGRVRETDDLVAIDDAAFFIRCVVPVPVEGRDAPYCWGFWVKVARERFDEYRRFSAADPPADHPGFQGTLANQTPLLPPTLGLPVHVHLGRGRQWPRLMLLDEEHVLTRQQEVGVSAAQVHAWSDRCAPRDLGEPRLDPPAPPFTATLEEHGWCVADAAAVGRAPRAIEAPPRPGDLVRAPFAFLAAGPHGERARRVELLWVLLDEVRADGRWSGTLNDHPSVPGALDRGTRVWLAAKHVVGHHQAMPPTPAPDPAARAAPGFVERLRRWVLGRRDEE